MDITKLILIILIPVVILIGIALYFIVRNFKKTKGRELQANKIGTQIKAERLSKADTIISRVKTISDQNTEYREKFLKLEKLYIKMEQSIKETKEEFIALSANKKQPKKVWKESLERLQTKISMIDKIENQFNNLTIEITQQETFLWQEFTFYSKNLREVIAIYDQKRLSLSKINDNIVTLSNKIKQKSIRFKDEMNKGLTKEASFTLRKYSNLVYKFAHIVSEAPSIQTYLYSTIPFIMKNLMEMYKTKKEEIKAPLSHLNFSNSVKNISKIFQDSKSQFKSLEFNKVKENIKTILKTVRSIETMINYEIISRNFFIENYQQIIRKCKFTLTQYVSIRKQIKEIVAKGHKISPDLNQLILDSQNAAKELDNKAMEFADMVSNKDIAYSSKVSRMKIISFSLINMLDKLNEIIQSIWTYNVENSILKNKLRKCESAINEILANLKLQNVKLTDIEKDEHKHISNKMNSLSDIIENDIINRDAMNEANDLVRQTTSFYNSINGKIQIAEMVNNLIQELAPKRALDAKLNITLNNAEKAYLEGDYAKSLNTIIEEMEGDK